MARVTVLMPVYNVSLYIDESISSIAANFPGFRISYY